MKYKKNAEGKFIKIGEAISLVRYEVSAIDDNGKILKKYPKAISVGTALSGKKLISTLTGKADAQIAGSNSRVGHHWMFVNSDTNEKLFSESTPKSVVKKLK